jgi:hypothetical protein
MGVQWSSAKNNTKTPIIIDALEQQEILKLSSEKSLWGSDKNVD